MELLKMLEPKIVVKAMIWKIIDSLEGAEIQTITPGNRKKNAAYRGITLKSCLSKIEVRVKLMKYVPKVPKLLTRVE